MNITSASQVKIFTTGVVQGAKSVEYVNFVSSSLVVSRNMFSTMGSGFKSIIGGRLEGQIKLMENYRSQLLGEIRNKAFQQGANAVVGLRIDVDDVNGVMNFFGYATAVLIK